MPDEKETQRLIGFAREHARTALAKPETQRESYLAFCRLNWKRYAAGITRSTKEAERFAATLDRTTRELMTLMQDPAMAERVESVSPWYPLRDDAVEGALDSVTVHEAAIEPELPPPPREITPEQATKNALLEAEALFLQSQPRPIDPLPAPIEHTEAVAAEDEDRQAAKFGFGGLERLQPMQAAPVPKADPELKRKVQDLLRERLAAKLDDES